MNKKLTLIFACFLLSLSLVGCRNNAVPSPSPMITPPIVSDPIVTEPANTNPAMESPLMSPNVNEGTGGDLTESTTPQMSPTPKPAA